MDQMDDWEDFLALSAGTGMKTIDQGDVSEELPSTHGETIEAMEKVMRKRALARADTLVVVEESLLDAVRMREEDSGGRRDSGYFSLARSGTN